jgi:hypothetical protein
MSKTGRILIVSMAILFINSVMLPKRSAFAAESDLFIQRVETLFDHPDPDCPALVENAMAIMQIVRSIRVAVPALANAALEPLLASAVRQRLTRECAGIVRGRTPGNTVILSTRPVTDAWIVTTRREGTADPSQQIVVWRLVRGGPWGWRISDLSADGRGLVARLVSDAAGSLNAAPGDPDSAIRAIAR